MESMDVYDVYPPAMRSYLRNYGWNFSKKACELACSMMKRKEDGEERPKRIKPWSKEEVEQMLSNHGIQLEHNKGYNHVYVANYAKADFYKRCLPDEQYVARYVKDVIDDVDNKGGNVFRKWYCDMVAKGEPVEWEDML